MAEAKEGDVGSGAMPIYARGLGLRTDATEGGSDGEEMLVLQFNTKAGTQEWQVTGITQAAGGASSGIVYLRGAPPVSGEGVSNRFDPVSVQRWEVAVGIVAQDDPGAERTTKWVPAPDLVAVRGAEGQRHWTAAMKKEEL